jgi:uncharacterized protein (DUF1778 family)
MPLKVDARSQLNLKGARITSEFLALLKTAAGRQGQTVTDFIVDTTTAEAQRVVKGEAASGAAVPAKPEDVADKLAERFAEELAKRTAEQNARIDALAAKVDGHSTDQSSATMFAELRRLSRRTRRRG